MRDGRSAVPGCDVGEDVRLVARCVHGLESVLGAEILRCDGAVVDRVGHREVGYRTRGGGAAPRTADDVFLFAGRRPDVGPARADLAGLAALARTAGLDRLLRDRRACGGPPGLDGVAVSASYLGRRAYNRYDIEDAVGPVLAARAGVPYHARRSGAVPPSGAAEWRLTLDGAHATLLLRVADRPAHRRAYKTASVPGTLHPPVAAAMARLTRLGPGQRVVDPCCGAGTPLIEAWQLSPGVTLTGFDLDPAALRAARRNAAGLPIRFRRADAGALPVPDAGADRVLCNPPWGARVPPRGRLTRGAEGWWREIARVLTPDGTAVVLLPDAHALSPALEYGLVPSYVRQLSIAGRHPLLARLDRR